MDERLSVNLPLEISYVHGTVNGEEADFELAGEGVWVAAVPKSSKGEYKILITAYNNLGTASIYETTIYKLAEVLPFKTDWTSQDYYNFEDLNRVENNTIAVKDLAEILRGEIFIEGIDIDRDMKSIPFADTLNRIEGNINKLGNKLYKPKGWSPPKLEWDYNQPFDFTDANRLEQNLLLLYNYAKGNIDKIPYCGMYTCGEEVI